MKDQRLGSRALVLVVVLFSLTSCVRSLAPAVEPLDLRTAIYTNYQLVEKFYCEKLKWPNSVQDLKTFAESRNFPHQLDVFKDPTFVSYREPELTVSFEIDPKTKERQDVAMIMGSCAQDGKTIELARGQLRLPFPEQFEELNSSEIADRYGQGRAPYPDYVFVDRASDALLSIYFSPAVQEGSLKALKATQLSFEKLYADTTPGVRWINRGLIKLQDKQWIHLELESDSSLGRLYNDMYFTNFNGRLLALYFVVPSKSLSELQPRFKKVRAGIEINKLVLKD